MKPITEEKKIMGLKFDTHPKSSYLGRFDKENPTDMAELAIVKKMVGFLIEIQEMFIAMLGKIAHINGVLNVNLVKFIKRESVQKLVNL